MDRLEWTQRECSAGETVLMRQNGVRIYDGDTKSDYDDGNVAVTTHRILWFRSGSHERTLGIPLKLAIYAEEHTSFLKSTKIIIHLATPSADRNPGPIERSSADYIKLSFHNGGSSEFLKAFQNAHSKREWERQPQEFSSAPGRPVVKTRKGIVGIERKLEEKQKGINEDISKAFEDLNNLMNMAKNMVAISKSISQKIKEKQGEITEDETIKFKSYLLSLGIDDPVTRDTHQTDSEYFNNLAIEISKAMQEPLKEAGGLLPLANVYCRLNRARSFDLVSPDDLINACRCMDSLGLGVRLKVFDSGVMVLQLRSHDEQKAAEQIATLLKENDSLSADELSRATGLPVVLAAERLLDTESRGLACRDDSVHGLRFYKNLFLLNDE